MAGFSDRTFILLSFIFCVESEKGCPKPSLPAHLYIEPNREVYRVNEAVSYRCSFFHYLFGIKNQTCLENGKWNASTPNCATESDKVKLKENGELYRTILDKKILECPPLRISSPIYLQVEGCHHMVGVRVSVPFDFSVPLKVRYQNDQNTTESTNYTAHYNYEQCSEVTNVTYKGRKEFTCYFDRRLESPIISLEANNSFCAVCQICEVEIFLNEVRVPDSDVRMFILIYTLPTFSVVGLLVIVLAVMLRKRKKRKEQHASGKVQYGKSVSLVKNEKTDCQLDQNHVYDTVIPGTSCSSLRHEPLYANVKRPFANSLPVTDEDGYLAPIRKCYS